MTVSEMHKMLPRTSKCMMPPYIAVSFAAYDIQQFCTHMAVG